MKIQTLAVFLIVLYLPSVYAASQPMDQVNLRSNSSKIHPILVQWQTSQDRAQFAKDNGLSYRDGKVAVYIYLDSAESQSKIPSDIEITGHDSNIAVAFVTSSQLDTLAKLGFVEHVSLPELAQVSSLPKIEKTEPETVEQTNYAIPAIVVIGAVAIGAALLFIVIKRIKR